MKLGNYLLLIVLSALSVGCRENFDERLAREAREYTKRSCPNEPEKGTRLDSVTYSIPTHTYSLWYSLSEENEQVFKSQKPLLHPLLVKRLKADVNYNALKKENVRFAFVYHSMNSGKIVFTTLIEPKEYNRAE